MRRVIVAAVVIAASPRAHAQRQPGWELRVPERVEVAAGGTATVAIAIAVDRGLVVSRDAPVIVDLAPDAALSVKKRRLGRGDAVDPEADAPRFAVAVRAPDAAAEPGEHAVAVRIRLWVCGGKVCKPLDEHRKVTVVVGR
ncbi:MAG: hypothetical protein KIT31_41335 [Deltaproteobacteria bacterium]|nr:hypothetical protein [Deltaproteobacteria bacterium]